MTHKKDYNNEALQLAKAIDFAIDSIVKYPPKDFTEANVKNFVKLYSDWKISVLNPEPKFKKIASLKYYIKDVFTYFQESSGECIDYFWKQVKMENLGYVRKDLLRKIIERGKIKGRVEYEHIIDSIIVAEQENRITKREFKKLSLMIAKFENG